PDPEDEYSNASARHINPRGPVDEYREPSTPNSPPTRYEIRFRKLFTKCQGKTALYPNSKSFKSDTDVPDVPKISPCQHRFTRSPKSPYFHQPPTVPPSTYPSYQRIKQYTLSREYYLVFVVPATVCASLVTRDGTQICILLKACTSHRRVSRDQPEGSPTYHPTPKMNTLMPQPDT
ncbi:unnamed protein product, partial [Ectocarpus sp. 6 AP-2014]